MSFAEISKDQEQNYQIIILMSLKVNTMCYTGVKYPLTSIKLLSIKIILGSFTFNPIQNLRVSLLAAVYKDKVYKDTKPVYR